MSATHSICEDYVSNSVHKLRDDVYRFLRVWLRN